MESRPGFAGSSNKHCKLCEEKEMISGLEQLSRVTVAEGHSGKVCDFCPFGHCYPTVSLATYKLSIILLV